MSKVEDQIDIDVPVKRVWETIMDPAHLEDWVTIHKSVENYPPPPLRAGATMDQSMAVRGLTFSVHWRLTELDPPHHARWEGEGPAHSVALIQYELSGEKSGPTTFRYLNEFRAPGGRLGRLAGRFIVGATSEREARNSLLRLKSLLEES